MSARILVVDDVAANVKVLEAKLTAEYFDVVTAPDGPAALAAVAAQHPDVILLDVMMPGMDGFETCRRLKADPATAHIPVVMVTALSDVSDRVRGLEAGADDFLTKPVNDVALFARIKSLARLKAIRDEWRRREETCDRFGVMPGPVPAFDADARGCQLLGVEKREIERRKIAALLEREQSVVTWAADGEHALSLATERDFDLFIIGDLPGTGADEALRLCVRLRSGTVSRHTPILLVVDESDTSRFVKGLEIGVNDYVMRPIEPSEFVARVRTQIRWKRYQAELRLNYERSLSLALTDSLTSLHNHRYASVHLASALRRMEEGGRPVGVLMVDIDHFKQINDEFGHGAGDEVLREMAARLLNGVRSFDTVARLGGEEFLVVLQDATPAILNGVAERLRATVARAPFACEAAGQGLNVTVSIGAVLAATPGEAATDLLRRADEALYQAKREGRNRVIADPPEVEVAARGVAPA